MSRLYLITGFLGAGKTTFLKQLLAACKGKKVALIVNEFGREGIDGELLCHDAANLFEVNNGSIFCACRLEQFADAIKAAQATDPDDIIVEASGLSDPTNIRKILSREDFSDICYGGCVCLIDAFNIVKVLTTAAVCKKQLLCADLAILNKVDLIDEKDKSAVLKLLADTIPTVKILETSFGMLQEEWVSEIFHLSPSESNRNGIVTKDVSLRKYSIKIRENAEKDSVFCFVKSILKETYRLKGFVGLQGEIYLFDCVSDYFEARQYPQEITEKQKLQYLTVLSAGNLQTEQAIRRAMTEYPDVVDETVQ